MIETFHVAVFMKPFPSNYVNNIVDEGIGGLNIDGCRVNAGLLKATTTGRRTVKWGVGEGGSTYEKGTGWKGTTIGRYPTNVIHDGSESVLRVFPQSSVTGVRRKPDRVQQEAVSTPFTRGKNAPEYTDEGSASRFFWSFRE